MTKNTKKALTWITEILKKHQISFQITGGLAAIAYGATRELDDIDIDIPDGKFDLIIEDVKSFITYGPARFKSDKWDLLLMTLNYHGQEIDLSGANSTYIFNDNNQEWIKLSDDLTKISMQNIYGLVLPVISYVDLVNYKKILARNVDIIDINQMENYINQKNKS